MSIFQSALAARQAAEQTALSLVAHIGALHTKNVFLSFFAKPLTTDVARIVSLHETHQKDLNATAQFIQTLTQDPTIQNARIDVGIALRDQKSTQDLVGSGNTQPKDVVLYGFGRIGRILARLLTAQTSTHGLQLRAIVVRPGADGDLAKRASLLERDSVHGWFDGSVVLDEQNQGILVNGRFVQIIYAQDPAEINYTAYGIQNALVIDNTGKFKDEAGLGKHLQSQGVDKVLLTAPAKGDIKNIVFGVNDDTCSEDKIVSAASCTTNGITPTLKILNDQFGIENGHMETIHAFTNDQNLVDNHHKADRRGRAAPLNMVMTSTGAASAVAKAIPELKGKLSGSSVRVPTPNVSLAILNLNFKNSVGDKQSLNAFIQKMSQSPKWQDQIAYSDSPEAVSTDFVGCPQVAIFDAQSTIAEGNRATLYLWYDNEMGYSTQVLRVAERMAGIEYKHFA